MRKKTSCSEIGLPALLAFEPLGPTSISTGELVAPASNMMPATFTPATSATRMATRPFSGRNVARPRPSTTVSGRVTCSVWFSRCTPGVTRRCLPWASALLMVAADVPGRTTKKSASEMDVPAGVLLNQEVPDELVRSAGTNTRYSPFVKYRNGFSRTTGVVPMTVWDGLGKFGGGAPCTPVNTMFHTEPDQLPNSLLREYHCCCEPETTLPSTFVSAIRPPLDQPSPPFQSWIWFWAPRRCIRRYGAACETAHRSTVTPAGSVTDRFSAARQKFWVALPPIQNASTRTWPLRLTSSGEKPRPATCVKNPRLTSAVYVPGLNSTAYRSGPNWLVSCWVKRLFSRLWMVAVGVDGSYTNTFGPKFGFRGSVGSTGVPVGGGVVGAGVVGVVPPTVCTANSQSE
jgi:hypothetical protein